MTLLEGAEETLSARLLGPNGELLSGRPVSWSSDSPGVADVTPTGTLRGVSPGMTVVPAQVAGLSASTAVVVLQGPTIALSSQLLQLGGPSGEAPLEQVIDVDKSGNGSLVGLGVSVEIDNGGAGAWLVATLESASPPINVAAQVIVQVILEDLLPGFYTGRVIVRDPAALNSSQTIEIELSVGEPLPRIDLRPTVSFLSAASGTVQPATQDVSVENGGGGVLDGLMTDITYISGGLEGWLTASFTGAQAPTTLEIVANGRFLPPGTYVANIEVTATSVPGAGTTVRVTFTVQ